MPSPTIPDRTFGALLGTAVGDALGVPYEFARRLGPAEIPEMVGGGLGSYQPGEWSDDTTMAVAIAQAVADGHDLTSDAGLDAVARGFLRWYTDFDGIPPDIGNQTRAVLAATSRRLDADPDASVGAVMREEALVYAAENPRSAGNGALMRTAPVAVAHLDSRDVLADAARAVAGLTHADALAGDSCVVWCEAIRVAITDERLDVRAGLDLLPAARRDQWSAWLDDAATQDPGRFSANGFTVTALQAATAAVLQTPIGDDPSAHLEQALYAAIRIGHDTDTIAAIAGGLLGARWGARAIADEYRDAVHGWPFVDGRATDADDLRRMVDAVR
ncbi:ADP-ribosylglycohydrolase family protein [Gordonia sp. DT30]|uniref:ADP-ribosylglycohydrolase family protein n=1 Tax=Gordonia sp. DT30 TaxID=3416546 RepID=UPI003CEDD0F9